jgi:hypothetical protein
MNPYGRATATMQPTTPCPCCGCREVLPTPPDPQRSRPGLLCPQCGIERGDLEPFEDDPEQRVPVPPCPACGSRAVRIELMRRETRRAATAADRAENFTARSQPELISRLMDDDDMIPPTPWGIQISGDHLRIGSVSPEEPDRVDETVFVMDFGEDVNREIELARAQFIVAAVNSYAAGSAT